MDDNSLTLKKQTKFPKTFIGPENDISDNDLDGGISSNGRYGWLYSATYIKIHALDSGQPIWRYDFSQLFREKSSEISTVVEVKVPNCRSLVLSIGTRSLNSNGGIYLFSINSPRPLYFMELSENVTTIGYVDSLQIESLIENFDGILIVGTESGKTLLIDLELQNVKNVLTNRQRSSINMPCLTMPVNQNKTQVDKCHRQAKKQNCFFGLELNVLENSGSVLSVLAIPRLNTLFVGLHDGQMVLYNLDTLEAFHRALPPATNSPLTHLSFMEPADDPKACAYVWAFHDTPEMAIAVMHSLMFEKKFIEDEKTVYETFQYSRVRLTMPMLDRGTVPLNCQSICSPLSPEDSVTSVCLLAWKTERKSTFLLIFDLNQWYKAQMPWIANWRELPNYLAVYPLNEDPLSIWLDTKSLNWFNSIQRPEEHFYPSALAFDCINLTRFYTQRLNWPGLQNRALSLLEYCGPNAILEPDMCFRAMIGAALIPQLSEETFKLDSSLSTKRGLLLSIALEYNCVGLLMKCARVWADGSHIGKNPSDGLSLSTLTDWIWNRARAIKQCCNTLCIPLFDGLHNHLGASEQETLSHCTNQLKWLAELMQMILGSCKQYIPEDVSEKLQEQFSSIQLSSQYQTVLLWMFHMGLLPEGERRSSYDSSTPMLYPYETLRNFYTQRREEFFEAEKGSLLNAKWKSCSLLYIDAFIENECGGVSVYEEWKHDRGSGLYPPDSFQSLLRILLIPNISIQVKYSIFMYLFLDLNVIFGSEDCMGLVQNLIKFPARFNMKADMIKITKAFWHLDHKDFEAAVEDLPTPSLSKWQMELLLKCLIAHGRSNLGLRVLKQSGPNISPQIEVSILVENNFISEAYSKQRGDKELLIDFYKCCYKMGKLNKILNLPLTDAEGRLLAEFVESTESSIAHNIHFKYLMQRSKYMEAVDFVDKWKSSRHSSNTDIETAEYVLSAYKSSMPPLFQELADIYKKSGQRLRNMPSKSNPTIPLGTQLITSRLDANNSIFELTISAVKDATNYNLFNSPGKSTSKVPFVPFLSKPLQELTCDLGPSSAVQPQLIENTTKRPRFDDSEENPSKRQKTSSINTTLLTSFQSKKSQNMDFTNVSLVNSTLHTPVVKNKNRSRMESHSTEISKRTPPSILKTKNIFNEASVPKPTSLFKRMSVEEEEKSIRFRSSQSPSNVSFNVSAIKPTESMLGGPKPRRALRSITPEFVCSTQIPVEKTKTKDENRVKEVFEKMETEKEAEKCLEKLPSPKKSQENRQTEVLPSTSKDPEPEDGSILSALRSKNKESSQNPYAPSLRRSLRSRTPEVKQEIPKFVSPRRGRSKTPTSSTQTKVSSQTVTKSLSRYVLESNTKKVMLEEKLECVERIQQGVNESLDSTLPMSDYSLNVTEVEERPVLSDNSFISESFINAWKSKKEEELKKNRDSIMSEAPSVEVNLLDSGLNFTLPENEHEQSGFGVSEIVEEDQLQEDTLFVPRETAQKERQEVLEVVEEEQVDVEMEDNQQEMDNHQQVEEEPKENIQGLQQLQEEPNENNQDNCQLQEDTNQDLRQLIEEPQENIEELQEQQEIVETEIVQPVIEANNQLTFTVGKPVSLAQEGLSSESGSETVEEEEDFNESYSDENELEIDVEGNNELSDRESKEETSEDDEDDLDDEDEDDEDDDDFDEDDEPKKAFKTNEVIDLLDSSEDEDNKPEQKKNDTHPKEIIHKIHRASSNEPESQNSSDSRETETNKTKPAIFSNLEQLDAAKIENIEVPVEEKLPPPSTIQSVFSSISYPDHKLPNILFEGEKEIQSPSFELVEEQIITEQEEGNIYDDLEMVTENSNALDKGVILEEAPEPMETDSDIVNQDPGQSNVPIQIEPLSPILGNRNTISATDSTENFLNKGQLMDESLLSKDNSEMDVDKTDDVLNRGRFTDFHKSYSEEDVKEKDEYEGREEVIEVIPLPKVAYQCTNDSEVPKKENNEKVEKEVEDKISEKLEELTERLLEKENVEVEKEAFKNLPSPKKSEENPTPEDVTELNIKEAKEESKNNKTPEEQTSTEPTPGTSKNFEAKSKTSGRPRRKTADESESNDKALAIPEENAEDALDLHISDTESQTSTPETLQLSITLERTKRSRRSVSQPKTLVSSKPAAVKTRRATIEFHGIGSMDKVELSVTPVKTRRSTQHLDAIEERSTPKLRMTPVRMQRMGSMENVSTPTRKTRYSVDRQTPTRTPSTRGAKLEVPEEIEEENEEETKTKKTRSKRKDSDNDDSKSTASSTISTTRKGRKTKVAEPTIPEESETNTADYSATRRLTRNQLHVLERSMKFRQSIDTSLTASPATTTDDREGESDTESMSSKMSKSSQPRRSTRARSKESDISESGGSVRSSVSGRGRGRKANANQFLTPSKKKKLTAIPETESLKDKSEDGDSSRSDSLNSSIPEAATPQKRKGRKPRKLSTDSK